MKIILKALEREHMQKILEERSQVLETLRTPFLLNSEMQEEFFKNILSNRESHTRYWALYNDFGEFIGMGGVENISWENRNAELSILIFKNYRGNHYGESSVIEILNQAFKYLNLENVWGECYKSGNIKFWEKMINKYKAYSTILPERKFYNFKYWDSLYFNFTRNNF